MRPFKRALASVFIWLFAGCVASPERYDVAYIEQIPSPSHLRFLSITGALSSPVFLPNGMAVYESGHNSLSWSPDGRSIAFAARLSGGNLDIYTIKANGTNLRQITINTAREESPDWSPDGSKILFLTNRHDTNFRDIYQIDLTTGTETRLTPSSDFYLSPVWSPDGQKIAYLRTVSFSIGEEAVILDLATGSTSQVGLLGGFGQGLRWAPSSDRLIFYRPGSFGDVYTIKTDGTGLRNLTSEESNEMSSQPSWFVGGQVLYIRAVASVASFYRMAVDGTGKALVAALESFPWGPAYRSVPVDLPDLIVSSFASSFSADNPPKYVVEFKVRNIGTAASGATTTYIDAINLAPPLGQNEIRIQNQAALPGLEPGQETPVIRTAFDLANIFAKEVRLMRITVDPKNLVDEAFETNNQAERAWP